MAELVELLSDVDAMEMQPDDFVDHPSYNTMQLMPIRQETFSICIGL